MSTDRDVHTLHRYFIWADRMRVHLRESLPTGPEANSDRLFEDVHALPYMAYGYGGMHVLIEGWRELQLTDPEIDRLLDSPYVELLRRYRNGAFHFQREYFDERFTGFWGGAEDSAHWIHELREAFSRWFRNHFEQRGKWAGCAGGHAVRSCVSSRRLRLTVGREAAPSRRASHGSAAPVPRHALRVHPAPTCRGSSPQASRG